MRAVVSEISLCNVGVRRVCRMVGAVPLPLTTQQMTRSSAVAERPCDVSCHWI